LAARAAANLVLAWNVFTISRLRETKAKTAEEAAFIRL
jgi:hypothetical protein